MSARHPPGAQCASWAPQSTMPYTIIFVSQLILSITDNFHAEKINQPAVYHFITAYHVSGRLKAFIFSQPVHSEKPKIAVLHDEL